MNQHALAKTGVQTPAPDGLDVCVKCNGAGRAVVSATIKYFDDETEVLKFCGHHFDTRSEGLDSLIIGVFDVRNQIQQPTLPKL